MTYYIWDGEQLLLELDKDAKVTKRYLRGNSLITTDNGKEEKITYVTNPHGDVVQLLDKTGKVIKTFDYDAFGNEVNPDEKDENPIRYAGEYFDVETGAQYLRARYYTPELGRFITRDTYTGEDEDSLSLHLYTYCENEPVGQVDPSGHWGEQFMNLIYNSPFVRNTAESYLKVIRFFPADKKAVVHAYLNYVKNIKIEKSLIDKQYHKEYITDQSKMSKMSYRSSNIGEAGCELIAVYNLLHIMDKKDIKLSELILHSELLGYNVFHSFFGTNPYRIGKLLSLNKIKYSVIKSTKKLKRKNNTKYIISVWNSTNILKGLHTYLALNSKGKSHKIITYNKEYSNRPCYAGSMRYNEMLKHTPFIIGYKIK